jgi:hypothetical protein
MAKSKATAITDETEETKAKANENAAENDDEPTVESSVLSPATSTVKTRTNEPMKAKDGNLLVRSMYEKRKDGGEDVVLRQGDILVYSTTEYKEVEDTPEVRELIRKGHLALKDDE